jgi:hypothetical protein
MKRTRRIGCGAAKLKTFQSLCQRLASAHSGVPAQKSMLRMVLIFIGITSGFLLDCARRILLFPGLMLSLRDWVLFIASGSQLGQIDSAAYTLRIRQ